MATLDRWAWSNGPLAVLDAIATDICLFLADAAVDADKKAEAKKLKTEYGTKNKTEKTEEKKEEHPQGTQIINLDEFKAEQEAAKSVLNFDVAEEKVPEPTERHMSSDDLENLLDNNVTWVTMASQINVDENQRDIKLISLALLAAIDRISVVQVAGNSHLLNLDDIIEVNTIYKFFTGSKLFANQGSIQLNEVVTSQLLYDTVAMLYEKTEWASDPVFSNIMEKVNKRLELEIASNGKLNQDEGAEEPVTPVFFNQTILGNPYGEVPKPNVGKSKLDFIQKTLEGLVPEQNTIEVKSFIDPYIPTSLRDTGCAQVNVKLGDVTILEELIDLDNIAANGFSLRVKAFMPYLNRIDYMWVNIEKFPHIITKALSVPGYTLNNPNDPQSVLEYNEVIQDRNYQPEMYLYYDFSGMNKHFAFMTNEDKETFGRNLAWISQANWQDMGPGEHQYRMRVREYKDPNNFTLVSDKNTRVQLPGMLEAVGGNFKKYVKDPLEDISDSSILVCKFRSGKIEVARDGRNLKNIKLPEEVWEAPKQ